MRIDLPFAPVGIETPLIRVLVLYQSAGRRATPFRLRNPPSAIRCGKAVRRFPSPCEPESWCQAEIAKMGLDLVVLSGCVGRASGYSDGCEWPGQCLLSMRTA